MTINHEAVVGLGMDAMTTMVRLADPEMIEGLNVGDAIEFATDRDGARWTS